MVECLNWDNQEKEITREVSSSPVVSIIVPVFDEIATLREIIFRLDEICQSKEVLIVDDGSTDGSREAVQAISHSPNFVAMFHSRNLGKGAAIRTALPSANGQIILIQDADLEYDPMDIERLIQPILLGDADVVYGSRFHPASRCSCSRLRRTANRILTWFCNRVSGLELTDMETGYKAFRREAIMRLRLRESGFGFEPEITVKAAKARLRIAEVPVAYVGRGYRDGKKIRVSDALRTVYCILRYRWLD